MKAARRLRVFALTVIPLAVFVSLVPLWPVYATIAAVITVGAGVILGSVIAVFASRFAWSLLTTALVTVAVFAVVGVPLAIPSKTLLGIVPTVDGLLTLASAVVLSWKQLVTVVTPVASYEALLVPALILSLAATVIGVSLALKPQRRALAALAPLVSLGFAIWLGPVRGFEMVAIAGAVFLLLVFWFAASGPRGARGILRALGVVAVPMLIAAVLVALLPSSPRTVWRALIDQPFVLETDTSPLAEYRSYVTGTGAAETMLRATGLSAGSRVTLATLDSYNGVVYSVGGTAADFTRVPGPIPTDTQQGDRVDSRITIENVSGPWIPLPAELGSLSFEGSGASSLTNNFYYSRTADTGAVLGGIHSGDRYAVSGVAHPLATPSAISGLAPGNASVPAPTVVPEGIDAFVASNSLGSASPGQRLSAVMAALLTDGYVSNGGAGEAASRSGHGSERLTQLFTQAPMVGDGEQYAAAAALLATQIGFPARVVMGFVVPSESAANTPAPTPSADAKKTDLGVPLLGADMSAWIEISTTQGWVAIDPNPVIRPIPEKLPEAPTTVSRPQSGAEPPPVDVPRLQEQTLPEAASGELTPLADPFQALIGTIVTVAASVLLAVGLITSPFLSVLALKARRRKRRRSAALPGDRVQGAWEEFADTATDHGYVLLASSTRREMARNVPQDRSVALAKLADRVQFAPGEPTEAQAEEAWRFVEQVREGLDAALTRGQRVRSRVTIRSLSHTRLARLLATITGRSRPRR